MFEIDLMRMTLIVGVVVAALIYQRVRLLSGGLMTGAYLALLISKGSPGDVIGWAIITVLSFAIIKLVAHFWAMPKAWLLTIAIVSSAAMHAAAVLLSGGKGNHDPVVFLGALQVVLAGGMYLTPGLTAYDLARQGWLRTLGVLVVVTGSTLVITLAVASMGNLSGPQLPLTTPVSVVYTDMSFPVVMLVCIAVAEVMRLSFGWGSGGIIGAVFFIELMVASIWSFFVIIALVVITVVITKYAQRILVMTPRQSFQFTFIVGALVAWIGLSLGTFMGIEIAAQPNLYALEPLLAVGLIATDVSRFGTKKTILGKVVVLLAVFLTNAAFIAGGVTAFSFIGFEAVLIIAFYMIGFIRVSRGWEHARAVGEMFPILPGTENVPIESDSEREKVRKRRRAAQLERQEKLHTLD